MPSIRAIFDFSNVDIAVFIDKSLQLDLARIEGNRLEDVRPMLFSDFEQLLDLRMGLFIEKALDLLLKRLVCRISIWKRILAQEFDSVRLILFFLIF